MLGEVGPTEPYTASQGALSLLPLHSTQRTSGFVLFTLMPTGLGLKLAHLRRDQG